MKKLNDSMNHPLRFITDDNRTIGQFYNSIDKKYHLAEYVPYDRPPQKYLCGKSGNFAISRSEIKSKRCVDFFKNIQE